MSGNVHPFVHLGDRGRATNKCKIISKYSDICRKGAELQMDIRQCPLIQTFGGQWQSFHQISGNANSFEYLADRGRATSRCQEMSKLFLIWRTRAKLPINLSECPLIWTFGGQWLSFHQMSGIVHSF